MRGLPKGSAATTNGRVSIMPEGAYAVTAAGQFGIASPACCRDFPVVGFLAATTVRTTLATAITAVAATEMSTTFVVAYSGGVSN